MIKTTMYQLNQLRLIEEVKKRPGLYRADQPPKWGKLQLWKEVGETMYEDWDSFDKSTAYDKILQLQRKWRSLRDAYNRELRARRGPPRLHRRVYIYFKRMSFLGGSENSVTEEYQDNKDNDLIFSNQLSEDPLNTTQSKPTHKTRRKKRKKSLSSTAEALEEVEMPAFPHETLDEEDSDKLFMMSFLPEMKQLPSNIKMWARAQIANIMQEAVTCHYSNSFPGTSNIDTEMKVFKQRRDSIEHYEENII